MIPLLLSLVVLNAWPVTTSDPRWAMRCHAAGGEARCAGETRGLTSSKSWHFHEGYEPVIADLKGVVEVDTDGTSVFARTGDGRVWLIRNAGQPGEDLLERRELPLSGASELIVGSQARCSQVGTSWRCRDLYGNWPVARALEGVEKLQLIQPPEHGGRLCALDDGRLRCFHHESSGLVEEGAALVGVRDFAASEAVLCIEGDDAVKCFGEWSYRRTPLEVDAPREPLVGWAGDASRICAWSTRTLYCAQEHAPRPREPVTRVSFVAVEGVEGVKHLELDVFGGCGEDARGRFCFGSAISVSPRKVPSISATRLAVSYGSSCAVNPSGVTCWGGARSGMDHRTRTLPAVPGFSLSESGSCVLADGKATLESDGRRSEYPAPGAVSMVCNWQGTRGCVVDGKGRATCFETDLDGRAVSTALPIHPVREVHLGSDGTAALDAKGALWLLGPFEFSKGTKLRRLPWPRVTTFDTDGFDLCAISAGRVRCSNTEFDAKRLAAIDDPVQVSVGIGHACVLRKSGKVQCERDPYNAATTLLERGAAQLSDVAEVAVSSDGGHACARHRDGSVSCWGGDASGQLGGGEGALGVVRLP